MTEPPGIGCCHSSWQFELGHRLLASLHASATAGRASPLLRLCARQFGKEGRHVPPTESRPTKALSLKGLAVCAAAQGLKRVLVQSRVTKHVALAFTTTDQVFAETLYVFALSSFSSFSSLQSRLHESWARFISSTMGDQLRYAASDCFETFSFPQADPRVVIPVLEAIGQRLYDTRASHMVTTQQGLTQTYNKLKDIGCHDPEILALRDLHLELDRAVLASYDWADLIPLVPPYTMPESDAEKRAVAAFEDAVIDRLFALNTERAEHERLAGAASATPAASRPKAATVTAKKTPGQAQNAQLALDSNDE